MYLYTSPCISLALTNNRFCQFLAFSLQKAFALLPMKSLRPAQLDLFAVLSSADSAGRSAENGAPSINGARRQKLRRSAHCRSLICSTWRRAASRFRGLGQTARHNKINSQGG